MGGRDMSKSWMTALGKRSECIAAEQGRKERGAKRENNEDE